MNSNRKFQVAICDNASNIIVQTISIEELIHGPEDNLSEWEYALRDDIDAVLDLKVGESMYFQPNRDNAGTKGIIFRIHPNS